MSPENLETYLRLAKNAGCSSVVIDGVTFNLSQENLAYGVEIGAVKPVPELKAEELVKPGEEELSDAELLYWSTPYFEELQALKEKKNEKAEE